MRVEDLPDEIRVRIEMQSGDAIEMVCDSLRVSDPA